MNRLGLMIVATILLSLIQLLPTYDWSKQSERTNPTSVVNVYGVLVQFMGWEWSENDDAQRSLSQPSQADWQFDFQFRDHEGIALSVHLCPEP